MSTKSLPILKNIIYPSPKNHFLPSIPSYTLSFPPNSFHFSSNFHHHKPFKINPIVASSPTNNSNSLPTDESQSHSLALTQEAIYEYLFELGISSEDCAFISSNSPKYAQMLNDDVQELEEWNSWKSSKDNDGDGENGEEGLVGFKAKVIQMAKEKGDDGKVAFLESVVGLTLSSAIGIARYLSAEPLHSLVPKVKYMKEIFFSDSNPQGLVGKNARRMMKHLTVPIDENLQQTLAFFEKIEARRGGLDMLGSADSSFRYLVESFPRLLLLSVECHLKPLVDFLETFGVPKEHVGNVLLLFPPILFWNVKSIRTKALVFEEIGAVENDVGKMLLKYPWILSTSIQENFEKILLFFEEQKVPKLSVDRAIRSWPHLLGCSTSKLKLMVEEISKLGVQKKKLGQVIAKSPQLLLCKPQEFLQVVSFLEDLGFDRENVGKILSRCPEVFATNTERTLNSKIDFLTEIGISKDHFPRAIKKYPELLVSDVEGTLLPRMKYLMEIGISKKDIAFMVRRFSPLLGYSIDQVFQPKIAFLINTMEKPLRTVVDYPRYFSYSLEKKIKPRFWVLKARNIECSLEDMLGKNDDEFATKFLGDGRMPPPPAHSNE